MPSTFGLSVVTNGLQPGLNGNQTSLVTGGLFSITIPQNGPLDSSPQIIAAANAQLINNPQTQISPPPPVITAALSIPIGNANLQFSLSDILQNPTSLTGQAVFNPDSALPGPNISHQTSYTNSVATYTGSDLRIIVDLVD